MFLEKSKNDSNQDGRTIFISKFDTEFCPVNLLEKYFAQGAIKVDCHEKAFLIPRLINVKEGHKLLT